MNPLDSLMSSPMAAALDTNIKPYPIGEYVAQIGTEEDSVKIMDGTVKKEGSANFGKPWYNLVIKMEITDPGLKQSMGRDKLPLRHSIMLDVENGRLTEGEEKNVGLGKLMKAAGINAVGATIMDLKGKTIKVKIKHRPDPVDPTVIYSEVGNVGAV